MMTVINDRLPRSIERDYLCSLNGESLGEAIEVINHIRRRESLAPISRTALVAEIKLGMKNFCGFIRGYKIPAEDQLKKLYKDLGFIQTAQKTVVPDVEFVSQQDAVYYKLDDICLRALRLILAFGEASNILIKRNLNVGYSHAWFILQHLIEAEILRQKDGPKGRYEIVMSRLEIYHRYPKACPGDWEYEIVERQSTLELMMRQQAAMINAGVEWSDDGFVVSSRGRRISEGKQRAKRKRIEAEKAKAEAYDPYQNAICKILQMMDSNRVIDWLEFTLPYGGYSPIMERIKRRLIENGVLIPKKSFGIKDLYTVATV